MPYPTIVRQTDMQAHIKNTLANINSGLYAYNKLSGQALWMPNEIKFDLLAIDTFQALPVVTNEGGTNTGVQTGTDTSVTAATTNDAPPSGQSSQVTTHGETSNTTDADQTELQGYDSTATLQTGIISGSTNGYLGAQPQPFPF